MPVCHLYTIPRHCCTRRRSETYSIHRAAHSDQEVLSSTYTAVQSLSRTARSSKEPLCKSLKSLARSLRASHNSTDSSLLLTSVSVLRAEGGGADIPLSILRVSRDDMTDSGLKVFEAQQKICSHQCCTTKPYSNMSWPVRTGDYLYASQVQLQLDRSNTEACTLTKERRSR